MMLKEIQKRLQTQNNRATPNPIFIVFDYKKIPSIDDYTTQWEYADIYDGYVTIGTTRESLLEYYKDYSELPTGIKNMSEEVLFHFLNDFFNKNIIKNYYIDVRVFIQAFFTEQSAKDFIEENKHHFSERIHIYVQSLNYNEEMITIRNALLNGKLWGD